MDLLGAPFDEQRLLSLGYSIERTLALRRAPFSTPALMAGKAPPPIAVTVSAPPSGPVLPKSLPPASVQFTYDEATARLQYTVTVDDRANDKVIAIWLNGGTKDQPGPARHQLYAGRAATGEVTLSAIDRRELKEGSLLVRFYSASGRSRAMDAPLALRR